MLLMQKLKSVAILVNDVYSNTCYNVQQDKWTPLMYSVKEGHTEVVKLLLEQDTVDILATNKVGDFLSCAHKLLKLIMLFFM